MKLGVEGIKAAARGTATAATVSPEKLEELQRVANGLKEELIDTAIVNGSVGMGGAAILDGIGNVIPYLPAKVACKGGAALWRLGGAIHAVEELGKVVEKHEQFTSNELEKEAMAQIKEANQVRRGDIMSKISQFTSSTKS